QVAPGGRVSVLAPAERRSYQLVPLVGEAARAPSSGAAAAPRVGTPPASHDLIALRARDTEPTEDSPIYYHERIYAVPPGVPLEEMEKKARAKLEELRKSLAGGPRGQFHNLAVYDHEWK